MWKNEFRKGQVGYDYSASDPKITSVDRNGKMYDYLSDNWGLNSLKRVKVSVKNGEKAIPNKTITAYDEKGNPEFIAKTDNAGDAGLFPSGGNGGFLIHQKAAVFSVIFGFGNVGKIGISEFFLISVVPIE